MNLKIEQGLSLSGRWSRSLARVKYPPPGSRGEKSVVQSLDRAALRKRTGRSWGGIVSVCVDDNSAGKWITRPNGFLFLRETLKGGLVSLMRTLVSFTATEVRLCVVPRKLDQTFWDVENKKDDKQRYQTRRYGQAAAASAEDQMPAARTNKG